MIASLRNEPRSLSELRRDLPLYERPTFVLNPGVSDMQQMQYPLSSPGCKIAGRSIRSDGVLRDAMPAN